MRPLVPALLAACALSGCDLAVAGFFTPGIGSPMTGVVVDAETHLPIGGATVLAGIGSTVTDGEGRFKLFGNFGSHEVSVSRAGYVAQTVGGLPVSPGEDLRFTLNPLYAVRPPVTTRFLEVSGTVSGLAPNGNAAVSLGGNTVAVSNGAYNVQFRGGVPGRVLTTILAWGTTNAAYAEGSAAPPQFSFSDFAYEVRHWPLGDTVPESKYPFPIEIRNQVPIKETKVSYTNLPEKAIGVQTDVALDFGVLGYVPVARANASSQRLNVPAQEGLKYVISGVAADGTGRGTSAVLLTTNDPGKAAFPLLTIPKIVAPAMGEVGVGQRPTFKWSAIPGDVLYEVEVRDLAEENPKWVGTTDVPEITYPGFSPSDVNGGSLRESEKGYVWSLRVIDMLEEDETPTNVRSLFGFDLKAGPTPVRPYRQRKREAQVIMNTFKP